MSYKKEKIQEDYEVIELGEDGSFDIPTPNKSRSDVSKSYEYEVPEISIPASSILSADISDEQINIESSIVPGGYKIYSDKTSLYIIFRLINGDEIQSVYLKGGNLSIETTLDKKYMIEIPANIKYQNSSPDAKTWKDFVTISFNLIL